METASGNPNEGKNFDLSEKVLGAAMAVSNALGAGFVESVYVGALVLEMVALGLAVESQKPMVVFYKSLPVGKFFADIVVENQMIVELKAVRALLPEHQAQVLNYLKASGIKVGLLINFGNPRLEIRRLSMDKDGGRGNCDSLTEASP